MLTKMETMNARGAKFVFLRHFCPARMRINISTYAVEWIFMIEFAYLVIWSLQKLTILRKNIKNEGLGLGLG